MATSINIELGYKDSAWFAANPTKVLLAGQIVYLQQTGTYKIGDGTTTLTALSFLGGSASTPTIQQVLTAGSTATTTITTTGFIKTAGTSAEFLKADGSVDSSTYLTTLGTAATSLTTTGTSGASTLIANVLNVPNYTLAAVNAQNLSVFAATTSLQLKNIISDETGSGALVFGTSPTFTTDITTPLINGVSGVINFSNTPTATGALITYNFTTAAHTNQTLSTNIPNFKVTGSTKQWATGALATQYFNYFTNNTVSFVAASTATDSYNTYIESVVAGTNATLTRKYSLGTSDNVAFGIANSAATLHLGVAPSASNYMLSNAAGAGSTYLNAPAGGFVVVSIGGGNKFQVNNSSISFSPTTATSTNATICYTFSFSSNTNQTLSTEISGVLYNNYSRQWATGNITTQREQYIKTATYTAIGASVITNAYGFYVEAPTASTNISITNNYALGLAGSLKINDTFNIVFDTTTGTKIGTATTQKIGIWNATPIVQPTTAVAAATIASPGAGNVIKTDDTFDGYTLQQIVKALRNTGLLA